MRRHQNENVLQEDEGVFNRESQKQGSQETSSEEISGVNNTPFTSFINLEQECVKALLGFLELENSEASENDGN